MFILIRYVSSKVFGGSAVFLYAFDVGVVVGVCDVQWAAVCLVVVAPFEMGCKLEG